MLSACSSLHTCVEKRRTAHCSCAGYALPWSTPEHTERTDAIAAQHSSNVHVMPPRKPYSIPFGPWLAFYAAVFAGLYGAYEVVSLRVALGAQQQKSLDALKANPTSFVWYTLDLPAKQRPATQTGDDAAARSIIDRWHETTGQKKTDDSDFAHLFVAAYGAWARSLDAAGAARLLKRHCGAREFRGMVKHDHDTACAGIVPAQPAACRGGFYLDDAAKVKPCPDGAFCMAGQTCFVLCARGAMCNASRPLSGVVPHQSSTLQSYDRRRCVFPRNAAPAQETSPEVHKCPGVQYLTLCPEGYYCRTPVEIKKCPSQHFCALGSDEPVRCPWFADCGRGGMTRPRYRASFGAMAWGGMLLLGACYYVAGVWRDRSLRAFDARVLKNIPRTPPRRRGSFEEDAYDLPDASPLVDVEFSDVSVKLPGGRVALRHASGALRAGRLAAIIGPSGAGKSTLLDLLSGRAPPPGSLVTGRVALNGLAPAHCHPALVGYVPQDDGALLGWLTVRELLRFYAVRSRRPL